jgi:hypothetical protein
MKTLQIKKLVNKIYQAACLAVLFLIPTVAQSQGTDATESNFACSYYGEDIAPEVKMYAGEPDAREVIEEILSVIGLRPNFEIRAANVPNAAAVILDSKRYILYNRQFISDINVASRNNWAGISIIAHEIGHHLNGHTLTGTGSRPDLELEADEFSGFVLNRLGASLADAQAAMSIAASLKASHTHPGKQDRLAAIQTGWKNAGGIASPKTKSKKNIERPVIVENPKTETVIAEKYIAFDVHFNADPAGIYYITIRGNLVNVSGDDLFIIGRLGESNKKGYKLMLADKNYNYLYIAAKGIIVNGLGKNVGYIGQHQ